MAKKEKTLQKRKKKNTKHLLKVKRGAFIIEKLACNIIERCKLPKAIELIKELGYNHDDILVREETSIGEKIIKIFPDKNICTKQKI